jgi:hypothetical protein
MLFLHLEVGSSSWGTTTAPWRPGTRRQQRDHHSSSRSKLAIDSSKGHKRSKSHQEWSTSRHTSCPHETVHERCLQKGSFLHSCQEYTQCSYSCQSTIGGRRRSRMTRGRAKSSGNSDPLIRFQPFSYCMLCTRPRCLSAYVGPDRTG